MAQEFAQGMTYLQLADRHGLSKSGVQYVMNKPEIKEIVNQAELQLIALVPLAVDVVRDTIKDRKDRNNFKAAVTVLGAMGVIPSHTPSRIYNTVINDNRTVPADQIPRIIEAFRLLEEADLAQEAEILDTDDKAAE